VAGTPDFATNVAINTPATTTVEVGRTVAWTAATTPANVNNGTITWRSDNPAIASVNGSGVITGNAPGKTKIYARVPGANNTSIESAGVEITVIPAPSAITITGNTTFELTGTNPIQYQFEYTITPSDAVQQRTVSWSSNSAVVAIDPSTGVATISGAGEAQITVTISDYTSIKQTITINVTSTVTPTTIAP
jgi:uncharacterized protein YjdB